MTCIQKETGQLYYSKNGTGSKILLAFHGFGQDNKIFNKWAEILGDDYTIYAFDLFYHGKSSRQNQSLSKDEWADYLRIFLEKERVDKFSVLGFSLGGRFAVSSSLTFSSRINELILIAPDGIFLNVWFKLATNPGIRWLFRYFMFHPKSLDRLIDINDRLRLVSPYLGDFVRKELGDHINRKRVYKSWNHFKTLGYSKSQLYKRFNKYPFKRRIILGSKDYIIPPKKILPIINRMGNFRIDILPIKHHQLIKPEVAKLLVPNKNE